MSLFRDQMAEDLANVLLNTDEFAEVGTYTPQGGTGSFALTLALGDSAPATESGDGGVDQGARIPALGVLSVFAAGMTGAGLTGKNPQRGDTWTVASGAMATTYRVDTFMPDSGGGLTFMLVRNDWMTASAAGSRGT